MLSKAGVCHRCSWDLKQLPMACTFWKSPFEAIRGRVTFPSTPHQMQPFCARWAEAQLLLSVLFVHPHLEPTKLLMCQLQLGRPSPPPSVPAYLDGCLFPSPSFSLSSIWESYCQVICICSTKMVRLNKSSFNCSKTCNHLQSLKWITSTNCVWQCACDGR